MFTNDFVAVATTLLSLSLLTGSGSAAPSSSRKTILVSRDPITLPDIPTIKSDYMVNNMPAVDTCVFYITKDLTGDAALQFARQNKYTTLYDVYDNDKAFGNGGFYKDITDQKLRHQWFQVTSRAYAQVCSGMAYLMLAPNQDVPATSIWVTDEFDAIMNGETGINLNQVNLVDPANFQVYGQYQPRKKVRSISSAALFNETETATVSTLKTRELPSQPDIIFLAYPRVEGLIFYNDDVGFVPGDCGLHVTQHQKADPSTDSYSYDIILKDGAGETLIEMDGIVLSTGSSGQVASTLPEPLTVTAGAVDDDPITFSYQGQNFDTNSAQCQIGAYDGGARQGDCGFTCY